MKRSEIKGKRVKKRAEVRARQWKAITKEAQR